MYSFHKLEKVDTIIKSLILLFIRVQIAFVFLKSGLTKIQDWDSTIALFEYEYHVPILSPYIAAILGTFGETFFPALLIFGIASRFSALSLFIVNIVAVTSYPGLGETGQLFHYWWGIVLLALIGSGGGIFSIDSLYINKLSKK